MTAADRSSRRRETLALLAVAATVTMWGYSSVAIKAVSTTGLITAFYRLWFAIPLLWILALATPAIRRELDREWLVGSLVGGSLFGFHQLFFFNSLKLTHVANVTILGALQPALVLLVAGPLFGERTGWKGIAWSGVAFAGTGLVVAGASGMPGWSLLGDALAVINLLSFTAYFLVSRRIRMRVGSWAYVVGLTTVAGFIMLAASLVTSQDFASPEGWEWVVLLSLAIFPGTLGHFLTNWAHAYAPAFVMSMMLLAVPVIASTGAYVVLGEPLTHLQLVGGAIVLVAIAIIVGSSRSPAPEVLAESAAATDAP